MPDVGSILGGEDEKPKQASKCGHGVTFICAGDTLVDAAGDVASGAAGAAGDAVMGGVVSWASEGAAWLVVKVGDQIDRSTRPAIGSAWFGRQ